MGLDMYLELRKSNSKYESRYSKDIHFDYPQAIKQFEAPIFDRNFKSMTITESYQIGYWRKANAIHKWFVDNCGNGEDRCQEMYLRLSDITKLLEECEKVLKDHTIAEEELPTTKGFFFGSLEYDDWYFEDIQYTYDLMKQVKEFLQDPENIDWEVVYKASW